jgi:hypothetical protein
MNNGQSYSPIPGEFQLERTPMIIGAALIGAGSIIGITGMVLGSATIFAAARRWFAELEVPPGELVKHKWGQTKAATVAGASAWQHHNGMHRTHA